MSRKNITIGLFGFGCVGYGLYHVLNQTPGLKANIKKICVRSAGKTRPIGKENFTYSKEELLDDPEIDTIVELIDDADAAFEIVSEALRRGKAVVSANKKMIAEHLPELIALQRRYNAPFLYEAACCASIPIIRNLEEYYDNDLLDSIEGIVNGSSNYILSQLSSGAGSYDAALKEAQAKGYAESNPILDTGGFDAKYKLLILAAHAFGTILRPEEILNIGIEDLDEPEFSYASEKQLRIKQVALAQKTSEGKIRAIVLPKFVDRGDKFYTVDDVFNGVKTKSFFSDSQFFSGKGAGAYPTASAVLSDLSALTYDYRYEYKKQVAGEALVPDNDFSLKIYLRTKTAFIDDILPFFDTTFVFNRQEKNSYIIGELKLASLIRIKREFVHPVSIVLLELSENQENKEAHFSESLEETEEVIPA